MSKFKYKFLIIGGGMAAASAAQSLREKDKEGSIGLISREKYPPYARPPLSKALWKGERTLEDIDLGTGELDIKMHLGRTATKIDVNNNKVYDDKDNEYSYLKLLLATGGTPKKIPGVDVPGIIYYRTKTDYEKLKEKVDKNKSFGVIGGGFIGSEIAAAIKMYKPSAEVTMIFLEEGIGEQLFPKKLSHFLNKYYNEKGVKVHPEEVVTNITKEGESFVVKTKSGNEFKFDSVVAGLGIKPNIELAKDANLKIEDNGVVVSRYLYTQNMDIFAAGDIAYYHNDILAEDLRVEHEDVAWTMGETAGKNMAGDGLVYDVLPYFYSDLFDYGYEAVGKINSNMDILEDWKEPYEEGVIYYLEKGKVKGVLLWNVWEKIEEAKKLIAEPGPFTMENLKGRI
ncbi:MAG: NAD(P)/FAD-dependent oxidoreductase [Promethearchaeota archaeon]|nr:MAG: NAD(P)/FAD-dependent oxidoreductase [Candidatus Lokiarchaeota archaeon]